MFVCFSCFFVFPFSQPFFLSFFPFSFSLKFLLFLALCFWEFSYDFLPFTKHVILFTKLKTSTHIKTTNMEHESFLQLTENARKWAKEKADLQASTCISISPYLIIGLWHMHICDCLLHSVLLIIELSGHIIWQPVLDRTPAQELYAPNSTDVQYLNKNGHSHKLLSYKYSHCWSVFLCCWLLLGEGTVLKYLW